MPRTRSTPNRGGRQNTLPFSNKITKPSATHSKPTKDAEAKAAKLVDEVELRAPSPAQSLDSVEVKVQEDSPAPESAAPEPKVPEPAAPEQKQAGKDEKRSSEEAQALKISEAQIKHYWKEKEDCRLVPRVHQKGVPIHDKILREFDLSSQYGPCIGIARSKRWKRANKLGLNPPIEVLAVLLKAEQPQERSQVDELMVSRAVIEG